MGNQLHWSAQLAVVLGFIGLFVMPLSFWLGALMILLGLSVPLIVFRKAKQKTNLPLDTRRMVSGTKQRNFDREKLGVLRFTLHQAGLDSNQPVIYTGDNTAITVRDILIDMLDVIEERCQPIESLATDIVAIYPRIFANVELALEKFTDIELVRIFIANKAIIDVQWNPEDEHASIREIVAH